MSGDPVAQPDESAFNIPNVLSVLRLPMAAAFFVVESTLGRGILLSLAALSDALDGWLARQFGQESRAGIILDPTFDKLFVLVVLTAFLRGPHLEWPQFMVLISRDLYVSLGFAVSRVLALDVPIHPRFSGKVVTVLQILTLFVLLLWPGWVGAVIVVVGIASLVAIVDYTIIGAVQLRRRADASA